jgi:hypothetical protein
LSHMRTFDTLSVVGSISCSVMIVTATPRPNKRGAGKGGIPSMLHAGRARAALPDHECSTS